MLTTLRIRQFAIIEDLTVEFGPGLNLLTGETGAGKSILVGALGLVAGQRADAGMVRRGAERAVVEAAFEPARPADLSELLVRRGIDAGEDGCLLVRREVGAGGGGRVLLNGSPATVTMLREIGERLLELHGQHAHQALLSPERHLELLDEFGGHRDERDAVRGAHAALQDAQRELHELRERVSGRRRRAEELREQVREIDAAAPRPGERDAIDAERRRLRHAGEIAVLLEEGVGLLYEGEPSAAALAAGAARRAARLAELDPALAELAGRIGQAQLELQDAGAALLEYRERESFDPARLDELEGRRVALERLCARFGADEREVLESRDRAARELEGLESLDDELRRAEAAVAAGVAAYLDAAGALTAARERARERLVPAVEAQLHALALARARFAVAFTAQRGPRIPGPDGGEVPCGTRGVERAEFLLAANPGEPERPLAKVASGGELSRVMLALHVVLEGAGAGRALVFDEVDAGVGGAVADAVGARLADLARRQQVLCVTHLPQVAAHADRHYHVRKRVEGGRTLAAIAPLSGSQRVDELARMLGGKRVSPASRKNAAELLAAAGSAPGRAARPRRRV